MSSSPEKDAEERSEPKPKRIMIDQNEKLDAVTPVASDALFCLQGLLGGHEVWTPELEREIAEWAAKQCEEVGMKHQQAEGTYPAGKKAGAFECRDIFQQNADCGGTEE